MFVPRAMLVSSAAVVEPFPFPPQSWFDAELYLGQRGHRYLSRATKFWLAACGSIENLDTATRDSDSLGIAVGTNFGAHHTLRGIHDVVLEAGAMALSPSFAPNFCINLIAGQAAIKYGARRFNLTITSPQTAGLDALAAGARELSSGRCSAVIAGAVEELSPAAERHREGAVASFLRRAEDAVGEAILSGFGEARLPLTGRIPAAWRDNFRSIAGSAGFLEGPALPLWIFTDPAVSTQTAKTLLLEAGLPASQINIRALPPAHATLEVIQALQATVEAARADAQSQNFAYAGARGALRLVRIDPCPVVGR